MLGLRFLSSFLGGIKVDWAAVYKFLPYIIACLFFLWWFWRGEQISANKAEISAQKTYISALQEANSLGQQQIEALRKQALGSLVAKEKAVKERAHALKERLKQNNDKDPLAPGFTFYLNELRDTALGSNLQYPPAP